MDVLILFHADVTVIYGVPTSVKLNVETRGNIAIATDAAVIVAEY